MSGLYVGRATCSVSYNNVTVKDVFYVVVRSTSHCKPLLTYALSRKLGIFAELASVNQSGLEAIIKRHSDVFTQEGVLNNGFVYDVPLTPNS